MKSFIIYVLPFIGGILFFQANAHADFDEASIFDLPLSELMALDIESKVASIVPEDELIVGSTVSIIPLEKMRQQGVRRLKDAFENELSVLPASNYGGSYPLSIRGHLKKNQTGVALLIDGIPISDVAHNNPNYFIPDWMPGTLNRIEMIKGPGSAIYGSDAFRGVVSMETFESEKDYYHACGAGATSDYGDGDFQISKGIGDNLLRVDISGGMASQGDQDLAFTYTDDTNYPEYGVYPETGTGSRKYEYQTKTGVFKLRFRPKEKFRAGFGYYYNEYDPCKFPGGLYNTYSHNSRKNDYSAHHAISHIFNGKAFYDTASGITISANTYYVTQKLRGTYGLGGYSPVEQKIMDDAELRTNRDKTISGVEITVTKPYRETHFMWLLSGSVKDEEIPKSEVFYRHLASGFERPLGVTTIDGFSRYVHSILGQIKWKFLDEKFYLLAGARFDNYEHVGEQFTPRLGLIYLPTLKNSVKLLYGRAFNAPSALNMKGESVGFKGNPDIDPEIIDVYELVYMYRGENWKLNLTGFHSYWHDGIVLAPYDNPEEPAYGATYENLWKSRSFGVEASLFRKINHFAFDLGVSLVKIEALDAENPYNPGEKKDREYDPSPTCSFLLNFYYSFMPHRIHLSIYNRILTDMKESSFFDDPDTDPPDDLKDYFRTDITVSKEIKSHVKMDFCVRNLWDRENRLPSFSGAENGYLEPGISAMLRVGYTF